MCRCWLLITGFGNCVSFPIGFQWNGRPLQNWLMNQPGTARVRLLRFISECERTARATCAWLLADAPQPAVRRTPGLNGQPHLQPTFSIRQLIGLLRE